MSSVFELVPPLQDVLALERILSVDARPVAFLLGHALLYASSFCCTFSPLKLFVRQSEP